MNHATSSWEFVEEPGRGNEVLDMCSFEKPESPVFAVRDLANRQLHLDEITVMGRPHQDGLVAKRDPVFVRLENLSCDGTSL